IIYAGFIGVIGFVLFPLWVDSLGPFLIASVLAGIGLGILLGAPLNVLVGECAGSNEEGSALGALSLIRQIGLSLFPTLYAGFVAGAFTNISPVMKAKYGDLGLDHVNGEENYGEVIEQINKITDPKTRLEALDTVSNILKAGFNQMYITAGILALFVMILGVYLSSRKQ